MIKSLLDFMANNEVEEVFSWLIRIESEFPHLLKLTINPVLKFMVEYRMENLISVTC